MGCDIHAVIERKQKTYGDSHEWLNCGDPDLGRNYELFSVLAGVRNYDGIEPVAEPKGLPSFKEWKTFADGERWISWESYDDKPCREIVDAAERYGEDGHSHSWLTLAEIKAYDTEQEINDRSYVETDGDGKVTMTYRGGSMVTAETPRVGARKVLRWPGEDEPTCWLRLIRYMEQAKWDGQSDDEIRLVFFFDN